MLEVLRYVLRTDAAPSRIDSMASLRAHSRSLAETFALPIDRAIAAGFAADRLGFAFAAGYQSALDALVPSGRVEPARDAVVRAFCASEQGGAHPRGIATRLEPIRDTGDYALHGKKRWATFAPVADVLLVVASLGTDAAGKNRLRVVRVGAALEGVSIHAMPATPFAPEIPHAEVILDGVVVSASDVLEGDGYDVYLKPFRTVEDVHVLGAVAGHVCAVARTYAWPHVLIEDIAFELAAVRALALLDATAPETHCGRNDSTLRGGRSHARSVDARAAASDLRAMRIETWGGLKLRITGGDDRDGSGNGPVVVLLHGFGAPGEDLVSLWRVLDVPRGTRFVFPEALLDLGGPYAGGRAWWNIDMARLEQSIARGETRDMTQQVPEGLTEARARVVEMLATVDEKLAPSKLVLGGFSQGAMLSCDVALRTDRPLAGLVLLSGTFLAESEWSPLMHARKSLPVFMSHGRADRLLPFAISEVLSERLAAAGLDVTWQPFNGGHEIPGGVLQGVGAFLRKALL